MTTEINEKEIEAAMSGWHRALIDAPDESVYERRRRCIRVALEAAARVREDEKLPCDVQLPGVKLKRGVRLSTLLTAIRQRKDWLEEQTKLPRMPVAAPAPISLADAEKAFLDRVWPRLQNGCYRTYNSIPIEIKWLNFNEFVRDGLCAVFEAIARVRAENDAFQDAVVTGLGAVKINADGTTERVDLRAETNAGKPHPDDEAVDRFAAAMKAKLKWEREERGRHGWNDPEVCSEEYLAKLLIEHLAKGNEGNFEDIANICMMLHQRGAHPRVLADALPAGKPEQRRKDHEQETD